MDIGNPQALWLLLLVAALFLFRRHQPRVRMAVGNIHLWREVAPTSAASLVARVRRHWLLILRIAFVVATAIALARPSVPAAERRVALILDVSASMGARSGETRRLDLAKARAISMVAAYPASTQVRLIAAGAAPRPLGDYTAGDPRLPLAIRSLEATAENADLAAAVSAARAGDNAPTSLHVISDAAPPVDAQRGISPSGDVQWVKVGAPVDNVAIVQLAARRLPSSPARGQVLVELRNYGRRALTTEIEIAVEGHRAARLPVRLEAGGNATSVADISPIEGIVTARLPGDDALPADDRRFAVVPRLGRARVLLVGGSFFLEKALSVNPTVAVEHTGSLQVETRDFSAATYDVLVCEGCQAPSDLRVPLLIAAPRGGRAAAPAMLSVSAPEHPLLAGLDLTGLAARPGTSRAPEPSENVIARVGDEPAIVAYERKGVRVVELRVDPADGELPLSPAFPVMIANTIDWLTARDRNPRQVIAGQPVEWLLHRGPPSAEVVLPDNRTLSIPVFENHLTVADTREAGIYRIRDGVSDDLFAVNPATDSESDLLTSTVDPRQAATAGRPVVSRREAFLTLLLFAFVLLTAEWWFRLHSMRRS